MSEPVRHVLPYVPDGAAYLQCIADLEWPVWLDSGGGRFDVIAAQPVRRLQGDEVSSEQFLSALREGLGEPLPMAAQTSPKPFIGGWIGYVSYEVGRQWMGLAPCAEPAVADGMRLGLYDWVVVLDHVEQRAEWVSLLRDPSTVTKMPNLLARFAEVRDLPESAATSGRLDDEGMSLATYRAAFSQLQRYIREGDTYQVNLTRRWHAHSSAEPFDLYRRLRAISPAPFGAYLAYPDFQVLSNSPEQFIRLQGQSVTTQPIKGTRPRHAAVASDQQLREDLANSDKDRAENLMIVDLLRNDLGKVCEPGSVKVPTLFAVESFAKVHHLVSTVEGQLRDGLDALDLFVACFPGGSITGAPKLRAMQIIDELEPLSRSLYCGSVLRWGYDGNFESNISIRTLLCKDQQLYYWAGGGIVADSAADAEYRESADKAAAFLALLDDEV